MGNRLKRCRDEDSQSADNRNPKKCKIKRMGGESMEIIRCNKKVVGQRITHGSTTKMNTGSVVSQSTVQLNEFNKKNSLFNPQKLQQVLMPTLDKIMPTFKKVYLKNCPRALRTGLSTIKNKLISGEYLEPWEYVEHVWSMFENVWQSSHSTSEVYEYCTELSKEFEQAVGPVMQSLGYCCGRKYKFDPQALCCSGKHHCTIPIDAESHLNSQDFRYSICEKCFDLSPGDTVILDEELPSQRNVKKDQFSKSKNDISIPEPFIDCKDCGRKLHQICVLYLDKNWPDGFVCDNCLAMKGAMPKGNPFNAKNLPRTKVDSHIETRLNSFLYKSQLNAGQVHIRMLLNSDEKTTVKAGMRKLFVESGEMNAVFPYRSKTLFAFQEQDGVDVCFFGLYIQEYGSECAHPNSRRVYLTYLDSVHFFEPRQYRTAVYHEILLGYMDYVKQLGYATVHLWACPPPSGENYIFYCHPIEQKIPNTNILQKWYKNLLEKGKSEGIVEDYKNILQQANADKLTSAAELPYFDEDFWPYFLEERITKLDQRAEAKAKKEGFHSKHKANKQTPSENNTRLMKQKTALKSKVFTTMRQHKRVFFIAQLHSRQSASLLPPIRDPDTYRACDLMNDHNAFFDFARDCKYEFSSLRRARFSTLHILYELHNGGHYKYVYTCNNCKNQVESWYHCRVCDDYDLCGDCKEQIDHIHEMDKLGLDPIDLQQANLSNGKHSRHSLLQSLTHALQCRDSNCSMPLCAKMKYAVGHAEFCKLTNDRCKICKQLNVLYVNHAKDCQNISCSFCRNTKVKLGQLQQQNLQRTQLIQMLKLRMAESYLKNFNDIITNRDPMASDSDNFSALMDQKAAASHQVLLNSITGTVHNARKYLQEIIKMVSGHVANQTTIVVPTNSIVQEQIGTSTQPCRIE